jgi:signal transduction histidine kinase
MLNSDRDVIIPKPQLAKSPSLQSAQILTELSIEQSKAVLIFTEATAQALRLTDAPVAILTAIGGSGYQIGAISGLAKFGSLPPQPDLRLELAGLEYCHDRVISGDGSLSISNCQQHPQLSQSPLCQVHGVRSYLGLPIITAAGDRLGTIAILDFQPREFSERDIDLLQLVSRLVASEFERQLLSQAQLNRWIGDLHYRVTPGFDDPIAAREHGGAGVIPQVEIDRNPVGIDPKSRSDRQFLDRSLKSQQQSAIQFKLMTHLAQELRTPLTSVLGMARVLQQEIYGTLSSKQKDYLGIIHHSGQQLVTIVDEISQLGGFLDPATGNDRVDRLQPTLKLVDLEMVCQLAIQSLEPLAQKKHHQIVLDLTSGGATSQLDREQIWLLDKDKIRQIIYYLGLSLIQASAIDRQISIQLFQLADSFQLQIATNDPQAILPDRYLIDAIVSPIRSILSPPPEPKIGQNLRISLGLALCHHLAASHGGKIDIIAKNRGYQLTLPLIAVSSVLTPLQPCHHPQLPQSNSSS